MVKNYLKASFVCTFCRYVDYAFASFTDEHLKNVRKSKQAVSGYAGSERLECQGIEKCLEYVFDQSSLSNISYRFREEDVADDITY